MELYFCEKCGNRVTDVDVRHGKGKLVGGLAWCAECLVYAQDEPAPPAPTAATGPRRRPGRRTSSARAPVPGGPAGGRAQPSARLSARKDADVPGKEPRNVLIVAIGGGVVVGLLIGLGVLFSMKSPTDRVADPDDAGRTSVAQGTEPGRVSSQESAGASPPAGSAESGPSAGPAASPGAAPSPGPKRTSAPVEPLFVNIWQPPTGKVFRTGSDVTIKVNSFGGDGTVAKVEFFRGSEKIGEAPGGKRSTTWKNVPEGEHKLKARVTDGSGNTGESPEVQITVGSRIPGVFVEAETGAGDADSEDYDGASGGKALSNFRGGGKKIEFVIKVGRRVPNAQVAIRGGWGAGRTRIKLGPADGNVRDRGSVQFPGKQEFVWKKRPLGGDIEPGRYRLVLETGRRRGGGAIDVVGIVSDAAFELLPNKVANGRLEENGWAVATGAGAGAGAGGRPEAEERPEAGARAAKKTPPAPKAPARKGTYDRLAKRFDKDKVTAKKIAAVGGAVAGSSSFDRLLKRELDGITLASKRGLAGRGSTAGSLKSSFEERLAAEKPEVVRICFDGTELDQRKVDEIRDDVRHIAERVMALGAIPVLYTLPVRKQKNKKGDGLIQRYNRMITRLGKSLKVPVVEAYGILNADANNLSRYFRGNSLKPEGLDAVNRSFVRLYRKLEAEIFGRGQVVAEEPGPAETGRRAARVVSGRKLDQNGGFEKTGKTGEVGEGWTKGQWGSGRGRYSVRLDRTNSHAGEHALVARTYADGVHPGVQQMLGSDLQPGRYEVRFWACADVGKTADVRVQLAGQDLPPATAGEDWAQIRMAASIGEKEKRRGLRLYVTTPKVRVWFDDVELVRLAD